MLSGSSAHRALSIPELLDVVFSYLDQVDNANNACVCRHWSEIALDSLWREVDNVRRLFNVLAPLRNYGQGMRYEFSRGLEPSDWERFKPYSRRVRRLRFCDDFMRSKALQSIFDAVARSRTTLAILPNLHTLEWIAPTFRSLNLSVLFMHDSVKHLIIGIPGEVVEVSPLSFFKDIVARMPAITELDLRIMAPASAIEKDTLFLFNNLPMLKKVTVPYCHITSGAITELSKLKNLGVVEFQWGEQQGRGDVKDVQLFSPVLSEGAFPSLWDLSLYASLDHVTRFFDQKFSPTNLTMLYVGSHVLETPASLCSFLNVIADNCQLLTVLYLELLSCHQPPEPAEDTSISFENLRPLLRCPNVTSFEITHEYPLRVTQDQIEELAHKWPSLKRLSLISDPVVLNPPSLTLRALLPFARHCPRLGHLGLYVQASVLDIPEHEEIKPFQALSQLALGLSDVADEGAVAMVLARLCPLGCEMEFGVTWHQLLDGEFSNDEIEDTVESVALADEVQRRCNQWREVARLLPLMTKLRLQERERSKNMTLELEDLRTRNRILMDRAKMDETGSCVIS
ncbi:hypothetical protein PLICRDRAFT_117337 [Plicaturopsis crispa FD-325 SS-3]|uniref:F-box domain-containing protein n=1 Tax=Plicaturopsis crispa FD-325 SS-3 TaxID=944288 RepID=A0A0C9SRR7_PLICR|nr:hypothetical protein PLICRDRAFT_117337 [Plicaturopsis crispa FD-325 SS-3]